MIVLDATTKSLEVLLTGAVATNQLPIVASYVDVTTTAYTPKANDTATNNTTAVTPVAAPAASTQRQVKLMTVFNADTAAAAVTVRLNSNSTFRTLHKVTLAVGSLLIYTDGEGFRAIDANGNILQAAGSSSSGSGAFTVISNTDTGAQNNWAPTGLSGNTLIEWNGAADAAITGLAGGVAGQLVTIKNVTAAKIATFAHLSGSSSAANQFTNYATVGTTPIAPGGSITYQHDGTNWKIVAHEQGAWITPAYAAGTYTTGSGTWTVDAGDVTTHKYRLSGRSLTFSVRIDTSSTATTPSELRVALPAGLTSNLSGQDAAVVFDNAVTSDVGVAAVTVGGTFVAVFLKTFGNWANSTNNTYLRFTLTFEVQ